MSRPLISCLLVTYNQEEWIEEALRSILAQTYSPLEIVVSDDCSSDGTYGLLQRLIAAYDGPHRVILRRNVERRNIMGHVAEAAAATSGEFIVVAAGDDVSLPHRVATLAAAWENSGRRAHAMNSALQQIDEKGVRGLVLPGCGGFAHTTLSEFADRSRGFYGASAAYSRAVFDRFGPVDPRNIFEDQILPFRGALLGEAVTLDDTLVLWRRLGNSASRQFLDRPAQARARLAQLVYQEQQVVYYTQQRIADIETVLRQDGPSESGLRELQSRLRETVRMADIVAAALQRPAPSLALLGAALRGALPLKQALKLLTLHRIPGLSDWWSRLRMGKRQNT